MTFPEKTGDEKAFVEDLWARRKVGYLLDQIRVNGEKKELVDEVMALAKKYGIATPYTSYLVVPDGPVPSGRPGGQGRRLRTVVPRCAAAAGDRRARRRCRVPNLPARPRPGRRRAKQAKRPDEKARRRGARPKGDRPRPRTTTKAAKKDAYNQARAC